MKSVSNTVVTCFSLLILCWLPVAQAVQFSTSDLAGTWSIYSIWDDPDVHAPGWDRGAITFDAAGTVIAGSYNDSTGASVTITSGSANVTSDGFVSASVVLDIPDTRNYSQFKMNESKSFISGVHTLASSGEITKIILIKQSGAVFNQSDLDGYWSIATYTEDPANTLPIYRMSSINIQSDGTLPTNGFVIVSTGTNTKVATGSTASLSNDGQMSMVMNMQDGENLTFTQHQMDSTRNIIAGVNTQSDGSYSFTVMVRRDTGGLTSMASLEGSWEFRIFYDNTNNDPGWTTGSFDVDDTGTVLGGMATDSDGTQNTITGGSFQDNGSGRYTATLQTTIGNIVVLFALSPSADVMAGVLAVLPNYFEIVTAVRIPVSQNNADLIVDFGSTGLWARMNDSSWEKLNNSSPDDVATGDVDGNGVDDVIADFGSTIGGIYIKRNGGTWSKLHNSSPQSMAIGDLDGNGSDDIVIDFGGIGLWARMNDSSWLKLNNSSPDQVVITDMDGNGVDDIIADFAGLFVKQNGGAWSKLHNTSPVTMGVGDLDGNGSGEVIVNFGGIGLWARMNNSSWLKLHNGSPDSIVAGDIDGNGAGDVVASFGSSFGGVWQKQNLGGWSKLNNNAPDQMIIGDIDADGQSDLVGAFNSSIGGIYIRRNNGSWGKLHNDSPEDLAIGELDGS